MTTTTLSHGMTKGKEELFRAGQPFTTPHVQGFPARGGAYLIVSRGIWNDDQKDKAIVVVTPPFIHRRTAIALSPTVNEGWLQYLQDLLDSDI